jgi:hypothetical protein
MMMVNGQAGGGRQGGHMSYARFGATIATSTVVMFGLTTALQRADAVGHAALQLTGEGGAGVIARADHNPVRPASGGRSAN